ncbi:hypothetical protein TRVA0_005S01222 [Trichomonascus vanleenenianus]|uniref:phosphatidic acid-binding protein CHM7 n=1 Tax=Trichomonascus vanleenenianus TaxID=2268995 RepID=UPI003ECB6798
MGDLAAFVSSNQHFTQRRIPSLYSDFRRLKTANRDGYVANIAAWKSLLLSAVASKSVFDDCSCLSSGEGLLDDLSTPGNGRPMAIDVVLDEMVAEKTVVPLSQFRCQSHSIFAWNWGLRPTMSWALRTSGVWDTSWKSGASGRLRPEKYVVVKALDEIAMAALDKLKKQTFDLSSYTHSIYSREMFGHALGTVKVGSKDVVLSPTDVECIITYLSRDKLHCIAADKTVVKVSLMGARPEAITEQDRAVASLRSTADQVSRRVDALSGQIRQCTSRAKNALVDNNRRLARYALQSRHIAQDTQSKTLDMLSNLEHVMSQIDAGTSHLEIVAALKSGVTIIGNLNEAVGGVDRVADLMDKIRDQSEEVDEIGKEISQLSEEGIDADEIDDELAAMLKQEKEKQLGRMPSVPTHELPQAESETDEDLSEQMAHLSTEDNKQKLPA